MTATLDPSLVERLGAGLRLREPLWRHTSYKIGGPADAFLTVRTADELIRAVTAATNTKVPWKLIGAASNLVIADDGVEGLVVKPILRQLRLAPGGRPAVQADAGCMLAAVAKRAALGGLSGLEWAASVPGTVGAAVVNNSGAFGSSVAECLEAALLYFPGEGNRVVTAQELGYAYRTSRLKQHEWRAAVLQATFRAQPGDPERLRARLDEVEEKRRQTQPFGPSVGSVFRNPPGSYAGLLIEQAGLKGLRIGGAEISPMHANFILNVGKASARDVAALIRHAQETVWAVHGVWLQTEVEFVGRWRTEEIPPAERPST